MKEIMRVIGEKREKMIHAAMRYGISHDITILYSQELDAWLNYYNRINNVQHRGKLNHGEHQNS